MENHRESHGNYKRFFAMIATAMVAMFCLMYLHSYQIVDHAWFSETRLFMTLLMGGSMMIIMLAFNDIKANGVAASQAEAEKRVEPDFVPTPE